MGHKETSLLLINEVNWSELPFTNVTKSNIGEHALSSCCQNIELEEVALLLLQKLSPEFDFQPERVNINLNHACSLSREIVALEIFKFKL